MYYIFVGEPCPNSIVKLLTVCLKTVYSRSLIINLEPWWGQMIRNTRPSDTVMDPQSIIPVALALAIYTLHSRCSGFLQGASSLAFSDALAKPEAVQEKSEQLECKAI